MTPARKTRFRIRLAATASVLALGLATSATAQTAAQTSAQTSDAEVNRLLEAQARTIAALEARLAVLEARETAAPTASTAAPLALASAPAAAPATRDSDIDWSKGAPEFSAGSFTFRPRGRVQIDASGTTGSDFDGRNITGTELRSARIGVEGSVGENVNYAVEVDYTDNSVSVRSANIELLREIAGLDASLTIGQRLNDRSLDGSSGVVSVPFVERNAVGTALGAQRGSFGVGLTGRLTGDNWHLTAAVTGEDLSNTGDDDDILTWTTRAHWNPVKGDALTLHLGGWALYEKYPEDPGSISRNSYIAGHFNDLVRVSSGSLVDPDNGMAYGLEAGAFGRSAWAYAEAGRRTVEGGPATATYEVDQDAWSLAAGWFLTGEKPGYSARNGTWTRTRVLRPVTDGGRGAWEIAARYDDYDFTDAPTGGDATAVTLGVNWYWNSQLRFMLNAIAWETDNRTGAYQGPDSGQTLVLRSQLTF